MAGGSEEEPGGAPASIGVHLIVAMIDVVGRINEVYCVVRHGAAPYREAPTSLLLIFENGVTGLAFCSLAAARNFRLAVYGSGGFAEVITLTMDVFRFIPAMQGRASHLSPIPDGGNQDTAFQFDR
jgi:predicted dehydrogenase